MKVRGSRTPGVLIALIGPDGCGKSTTTRVLLEKLSEGGKLQGETAYLGPWGQVELGTTRWLYRKGLVPEIIPWMSFLSARIGSWFGRKSREELPGSEHSFLHIVLKATKAQIRGLIYYPLLYRELRYRYKKTVAPALARGAVVIAERYVFDLRYIHDTVSIENYPLLRKWVCDFFPAPDLTFLLDNEPEKIHARKPQLSVEAIRWQRESYQRVLTELPHEVLRTDLGPGKVADEILSRVYGILKQKQGTR